LAACGPNHRELRIEQRQIDHLPLPAVHFDFPQRDHHRTGAVETRVGIRHVHRRQHRLAIGEAVQRREARHAFDQRAETGPAVVRTVLPPARDAHDHEPGIAFEQGLRREAHFLQRAGTEAFDEHLRAWYQLQQEFARFRLAQFEPEAFLVARIELPVDRHTVRLPVA